MNELESVWIETMVCFYSYFPSCYDFDKIYNSILDIY